jgi:histidinol dehydrogenase
MKTYVWNDTDSTVQAAVLARPALKRDAETQQAVAGILARVKRDGDAALRELARQYDGVELDDLTAMPDDFDRARERLSARERHAIEQAARNIETFHRAQLTPPIDVETAAGVRCERVTRPLQSVGLYVPAGTAPLPSTALMLGVPAKIAQCPTRIIASPAQPNGDIDAGVLYAAEVVGIDRVFKLGGAQAIAAMAYGTQSVPKVDKVFGPGSPWVTAAKAQVSQDPEGAARDMPAGPSEVLVVADDTANPAFVASDLLSQAEHGGDSQVLLITVSAQLAARVVEAIDEQKRALSRQSTVETALESSSIVLVDDLPTAIALANRYAPEHLILQVEQPRQWLAQIHAAGSVFLGPWTPESVGDYCSGTNHVLPTYGFARSYSSLGVADFMRSMTVQELTPEGLATIGPIAETLAALEGLDAHAQAVTRRLAALGGIPRP